MIAVDASTQSCDEIAPHPLQMRGNLAAELEISEQNSRQQTAASQLKLLSVSNPSDYRRIKQEVFRRLLECHHHINDDKSLRSLVWRHLNSLPSKYSLSVDPERWDVIREHMALLDDAGKLTNGVAAFFLRRIEIPCECDLDDSSESACVTPRSAPSFGVSPQTAAGLLHKALDEDERANSGSLELVFAGRDEIGTLKTLSEIIFKCGVNVKENHTFSTKNGYFLSVSVGECFDEDDELGERITQALNELSKSFSKRVSEKSKSRKRSQNGSSSHGVFEVELDKLSFEKMIGKGANSKVYRGRYRGQEVALKVVDPASVEETGLNDFMQEIDIMKKIRHKNVVQFIGASTSSDMFCIVTEYLQGSLYDVLRGKRKIENMPVHPMGGFHTCQVINLALDVSRGMEYLHSFDIMHRDLKSSNLMISETGQIKVVDFNLARIVCTEGVMTGETGTYRWMAPEVIEHKPYGKSADVYSFAVVLTELLTGMIPYKGLTPVQAAVGVVRSHLRPQLPKRTPAALTDLISMCWQHEPCERPTFEEISVNLTAISRKCENEKKKTTFAMASMASSGRRLDNGASTNILRRFFFTKT